MSLTTAEEALVRELIAVNPELLTLAGSEATIISKLGATKKNLGQLTAAGALSDTDLIFTRQGTLDRAATLSVLRTYALSGVPAASDTVAGVVELATVAEAVAGTDTSRAVTPAGLAAVAKPQGVSGSRKNLKISYTGTSTVVTITADELCLGNGSGSYVTLRNISLTANSGAASGAANSLDAGSWAFSTFYNLFVIYNGTTTALLWSTSATVPTLPSGYTHYARVGANKTQAATNYWMLGGSQDDLNFQYKVASGSNITLLPAIASGAAGTPGTTLVSSTISGVAPATATRISVMAYTPAGSLQVSPNSVATLSGGPALYLGPPAGGSMQCQAIFNLESTNMYYAATSGSAAVYALGWGDNL